MRILNGPGALAACTAIFIEHGSKLKVRDAYENVYDICVGLDYKHFGYYKDAKRNKSQELGYRIGEASSAANELFRATRRADVAPDKNWTVVVFLAVSRLCYDLHTDSAFIPYQWIRIRTAYEGYARRAVARKFFYFDHRHTSVHALALCSALPVDLHVMFLRVGYLGCILFTAPPFLPAAIDVLARERKSFYRLVRQDLLWLYAHRGGDFGMPHPDEDIRCIFGWILENWGRWGKFIKRSRNATAMHYSVTE